MHEPHLLSREIGRIRGAAAGPTLIVVGGIHGNEPAGAIAARRAIERLLASGEAGDHATLRGEIVALTGNLAALRLKRRFQAKDLNRQWTAARVAALHARPDRTGDDPEDLEQRELLEAIEAAIARARGAVYFMDLHTTSAKGIPFVLFGDTLPQRRFASAFPLPIILGLEEQVDGVMSEYFTHHGCITLGIEGGQHDDPASIDNLEAALYVALVAAGLVDLSPAATAGLSPAVIHERERIALEHERGYALLDSRRGHLPRVMEVVDRHAICEHDEFRMAAGFANLDRARAGQLLARDKRGEIRAPSDGLVILPLYQGQGDDGFFWGRPVSELRMRASEAIRRTHLDRALHLLPGVTRDPQCPDRLRVNTRIARLYPLDVFHAFGYRRIRQNGKELTVERQPG
ncbi:MAG: succinylglutamate desuccinylase/aspartoacylase family protein [Myxococcota bacterium]|nr:succinylglutamate desuccinylase/aspartoacylase family protein [Myxococcota bacterium]